MGQKSLIPRTNRRWYLKVLFLLAVTGILAVALATRAAAFPQDPRSLSMGNTGVSYGHASQAHINNPALLAPEFQRDRFSVSGTGGVRVADPEDTRDEIEDLFDYTEDFVDALDKFNEEYGHIGNDVDLEDLEDLQQAASSLSEQSDNIRATLDEISDKRLVGQATAGVGAAMPGMPKVGMSLHGTGWGSAGAALRLDENDLETLDGFARDMKKISNEDDEDKIEEILDEWLENDEVRDLTEEDLKSTVELQGAVVQEYGATFARSFDMVDRNVAFGLTPKLVRVWTVDHEASMEEDEYDDFEFDDIREDHTSFNLDAGVVTEFRERFQAGLAVHNLIPQSYDTAEDNEVDIDPRVRAGVSHHTSWTTVALELDITENAPTGIGYDTREIALGAEFNLWRTLMLRAGYRYNIAADSAIDANIYSLGLGMRVPLIGLQADIGAAGNPDDLAAGLQLGARW